MKEKEIIAYAIDKEATNELDEASLSLCSRSDEVDTVKEMKHAREVIAELKSTIRAKDLTSLAAPAIGYKDRIFCVNFSDNEIKTFINPIRTKQSGLVLSREKAAILPGKEYLIPRCNTVEIMYTTPMSKVESREISGAAAAVVQQEIDLLDGVLLSDIGLEIDEQFDNATEEERMELINFYLDSLDIKQKQIDTVIQEDPELKKISDAVDFMTKRDKGEITIEEGETLPQN